MTTGSWNRDSFYYNNGLSGPWTGRKWSRTWSGLDQGDSEPGLQGTVRAVTRFGLGAKHAEEIFDIIAEQRVEESNLLRVNLKAGKAEAWARAREQAQIRANRRLAASNEKWFNRLLAKNQSKERKLAEKEWRKLHGIKPPKRAKIRDQQRLARRGEPGYVPSFTLSVRSPNPERPKGPRRTKWDDHTYTMSETYLDDVQVSELVSLYPPDPIKSQMVAVMNSFSVTSWSAQTILTANHQIKLVDKLREKVIGSDFNAAVFLAEGNQTAELIGSHAKRIARVGGLALTGSYKAAARALYAGYFNPERLRAYRMINGRPQYLVRLTAKERNSAYLKHTRPEDWGKVVKSESSTAAARILEFQYGIRPLLSDVYAGAEALAHKLNVPFKKRVRVRIRKSYNTSRFSTWTIRQANGTYSNIGWAKAVGRQTHGRNLIAEFEEDDLPSLPQALGLLNPEVIVWEKIPFSFVFDWFNPIGPYLSARAFASGLKAKYVTSDKKTGRAFPPFSAYFQVPGWLVGYSQVSFSRAISYNLDVPKPHVKPLSKAASFEHLFNGLALVTAFVTGKSRIR